MTLLIATERVKRAAESQTCLNDQLRSDMRVVARAAHSMASSDAYAREVSALKNLIHHAWLYSGYQDCGFNKMTAEQRALYRDVIAESSALLEEEITNE